MSNEIEHITVEEATRISREALRNYKPQPATSNKDVMYFEALVRSWNKASEAERSKFLEYIAE
jgi:hypothetical protein